MPVFESMSGGLDRYAVTETIQKLYRKGDMMQSLHFEHETKHSRANIVITIVALCTMLVVGFGCVHALKQSGTDEPDHTSSDMETQAPTDI